MSSPLLMLAWGLVTGLNPVRLAVALLVISRPRPMQNLITYWVGCLTACITAVVVPLTLLQITPMFRSLAHDLSTPGTVANSTVRHIRFGMGVLALAIAAVMIVHSLTRRRQQAHSSTRGGNTSTLVLDSNTPAAISRLLARKDDSITEGGSANRRLLRRVRNAWENGSLWVAFVIGIAFGGVEPDVALFVLAVVFASGAAIGTQVIAAIAFVAGILAVVEITLVSYLATPAKTQAIVQRLHDWALAHRRKILITMCTAGGAALVASGVGSV